MFENIQWKILQNHSEYSKPKSLSNLKLIQFWEIKLQVTGTLSEILFNVQMHQAIAGLSTELEVKHSTKSTTPVLSLPFLWLLEVLGDRVNNASHSATCDCSKSLIWLKFQANFNPNLFLCIFKNIIIAHFKHFNQYFKH